MTSVLAVGMKSLHIQQTWYTLFCVIIISQSEFLQENERQNSMGPQSGIIWCEAFPEAEETFTTNKLEKSILWQSIKYTQWHIIILVMLTAAIQLTTAPLYSGLPSIIFMFCTLHDEKNIKMIFGILSTCTLSVIIIS